MQFLIKNKFDFNKLFSEGVTYRRLSEKEEIKREKINKTWVQQLSDESYKVWETAKKCLRNMEERSKENP